MSPLGVAADWFDWDPARVARELEEVPTIAPDLKFLDRGDALAPHGGWHGALPIWPFDRPEPASVSEFVSFPLEVLVLYSPVHPVLAPTIVPLRPEPAPMEMSLSKWHVLPDGALCLLQSEGMWIPESSTVELLLKACGWRIEYALLKRGKVDKMTTSGIVDDDRLDRLIEQSVDLAQNDDSY